jgi:hypothetical protein
LNKEVVDGESWPMRKNPVKKWLKNSKEMVNCKEFSGVKKEEIASFQFHADSCRTKTRKTKG